MTEELRGLDEVLRDADRQLRVGRPAVARAWSTGFTVLDGYLSGGLRSGELTLLGGAQGLGKTSMALQILRHAVSSGMSGVYFSFEHDETTFLERLLAIEAGLHAGPDAPPLRRIREALEATDGQFAPLAERLAWAPGGVEAVDGLRGYADRLLFHRSSGARTDVAAIRSTIMEVRGRTGRVPMVVVDYLQKVAVPHGAEYEDERVTVIVEGLKDLALEQEAPVLAVVAADKEGLASGKRLRLHHLRGSTALAYEADLVLVLNDKFDVVARHHLVYDAGNADRFHDWVILTIEKNRSGLGKIDLEFRKVLDQGRFDPDGRLVEEQLVDERVYVE